MARRKCIKKWEEWRRKSKEGWSRKNQNESERFQFRGGKVLGVVARTNSGVMYGWVYPEKNSYKEAEKWGF